MKKEMLGLVIVMVIGVAFAVHTYAQSPARDGGFESAVIYEPAAQIVEDCIETDDTPVHVYQTCIIEALLFRMVDLEERINAKTEERSRGPQ